MNRYSSLNTDQTRVLDLIASASSDRPISQSAISTAMHMSMPTDVVFDVLEALIDAHLITTMRHTRHGVTQDVYWPPGLKPIAAPSTQEIKKMSESKSSQLARLIVLHGPIKSSELSEKACDKGLNIPTKDIPGLMGIHVNRGEIHVKKHNSAMWYMTESQAMDWDEDVAAAGGERDNPVGAHVMSAPAALSDDGEPVRMRLIEALRMRLIEAYNKVANDLLALDDLETALGVEHRDELLAAVAAWKSREHDLLNDVAAANLIFSQLADTLKVEKPEQIPDALDELKHALSARAMQPEPTLGRLALLLIDSADLIEVDELDANCDPRIAQDAAKARIDQGHAARAVVVRIIGEAVRKVEWKEAA